MDRSRVKGLPAVKVLQVFASLDLGGAESRMMDVYRTIDKRMVEFDFLTMQTGPQYYEDEIQSGGGVVIKVPSPRQSGVVANLIAMLRVMKAGRYQVVHAHTSYHSGMVMLAARIAGVPIRVAHARTAGIAQNESLTLRASVSLGRMLINTLATHRLAVSKEAAEFLYKDTTGVLLLPNAVDTEKYLQVSQEETQALRREFRIATKAPVVGHVGRFERVKNHGFVVEVFKHILTYAPSAVLVLVGGGPLRPDIERLVREAGLTKHVVFAGIRSDVPVWMNVFDVLLLPSLYEGLSGVILEAQGSGLPSVQSANLTRQSDMGLGLTEFVPLSASPSEWARFAVRMIGMDRLPPSRIRAAFQRKGFDLSAELETLYSIYSWRSD